MSDWARRFSLDGRTALVTGASKGLGAKICDVFADAGADIVATARDMAGLEDTAATVKGHGRKCTVLAGELADVDDVRRIGREALEACGTIDILVNSAGLSHVESALDTTIEHWDHTFAVNVRAPFLLAQSLAPKMIAQRWGKIINISSQTGPLAIADHAAYAASKGALNSLTKSLTCEWARHNIQINAICPTVVMTPMGVRVWSDDKKSAPMLAHIPAGRFGEPVEIADLALYLASPASGFVNGAMMMIEGGYSSV
ncbi:MAG: glucose 1-dehydrogenase [Bauldia sp.]|nr:glucose 1-dehydrogenase [Bauldia sp.]